MRFFIKGLILAVLGVGLAGCNAAPPQILAYDACMGKIEALDKHLFPGNLASGKANRNMDKLLREQCRQCIYFRLSGDNGWGLWGCDDAGKQRVVEALGEEIYSHCGDSHSPAKVYAGGVYGRSCFEAYQWLADYKKWVAYGEGDG